MWFGGPEFRRQIRGQVPTLPHIPSLWMLSLFAGGVCVRQTVLCFGCVRRFAIVVNSFVVFYVGGRCLWVSSCLFASMWVVLWR